jgi:ATP-binding cassette, subfamily B, bacterial
MFLTRFLYRHLKGFRFLISLTIVLTFAGVGADILSAFPLKFIADAVSIPGYKGPTFPGSDVLVNLFQRGSPVEAIITLSVLLVIVLGLLKALLSSIQLYLASFIAKNLTIKLSKKLFHHMQCLSMSWHGKQKAGDLAQRITGNMVDLEKFVADGMIDFLAGSLTIFGVITVMLIASWQFTLLSIVIVPFLFVIVLRYTATIRAATKAEKKAEGKVADVATEAMDKVMEIKAFTLEGFMSSIFQRRTETRFEFGAHAGRLQAQFSPLVDVLLTVGTAIILGVGGYAALHPHDPPQIGFLTIPKGAVTLGTLTVFLAYLTKLYQPMRDLSKLMTLATSASSAGERIQEVLDQAPEDLDIPPNYTGARRLSGTITYEEVFFSYDPEGNLVLKGINLTIPAGKKFALVGLSGSGKTTLTNLLPRFYDVPKNRGRIKIDGIDIGTYPLAVLRQNVSVVLQDSILFEGTLRENIKIGRPDASEEEMVKAAEQACIHETIMKRPQGYDTRISGKDLSGGQRQRLAIARAILRNTPIIIMDEPTAALDAEAEAEVMRALEGLAERGTVLLITHRLSTVGKVDEIIVLDDGRVIEQGNFKFLLEKDGVFAHLWRAQHPSIESAEESKSIIESHEGNKSFILSSFQSKPHLSPQAFVSIQVNGQVTGTCRLDKEVLTVGRISGNDVRVPSQRVSRLHAKILLVDGMWVIKDAPSLNGLHYDGVKFEQRLLRDGDRIYLAPGVVLQYKEKQADPLPSHDLQLKEPLVDLASAHLLPKAQVLIEIERQIIGKRELDKREISIGRLSTNDVVIDSQHISRHQHARILWNNGMWLIKSNESNQDGMRYRRQITHRHVFANGDRIYLAPSVALQFELLP